MDSLTIIYTLSGILFTATIPTIIIEYVVLVLLREPDKRVRHSSVLINLITNITLNLCVIHFCYSLRSIVIGEVSVVTVEAFWYYCFLNNIRRAAAYSLLCNASSFIIGYLAFSIIAHI
ncbi:MAG: hypothetical protein K6F94_01550 [Bacteroidaceae bacterium]|nr:hypothetical protein [Bacteroidaceae bacterium]